MSAESCRAALEALTAAFEERLARERASRLRAEAALRSAASARTAAEGYACFSIGTIRSPFTADHGRPAGATGPAPTLRGAPRQGALAPDTRAILELSRFIPAASLDGLDEFSHVFLFWLFNDDEGKPRGGGASPPAAVANCPWVIAGRPYAAKVSPPGLFGTRTGVFATRSPHRPNSVGVSLCALRGVDAASGALLLSGVDLFDGTPIVDIKPACPYDCGACGASLPAAAPRGFPQPPPQAVRFPPWVESPLSSPPPIRVVWAPGATAAARASVLAGRARFYRGGCDLEADAFLRAITQVIGLDPRSFAHGRGTTAARHVTALESALATATAAVEGKERETEDARGVAVDGAQRQEAGAGVSSGDLSHDEAPPPAEAMLPLPGGVQKSYALRYDSVLLRLVYCTESDAGIPQVCAIEHCEDVVGAAE